MPNAFNLEKRKLFSNLVLISFLALVVGTMFLSNIFKTPIKGQKEVIEQSLVFSNKELDNVTSLSLKNKSGEFTFERADTQSSSQWHMTSPRDISVNSVFVEKLFSSLNVIKTKKLLDDDKANNSNFSLEKPTAILTLTDDKDKSIILSVGIMNTIDNSTYMKISGRNGIYHVEAPSISLENITLADLVESSVFDINFNTMTSFKIFKKASTVPTFEIHKKDGIWVTADDKALDIKRLEDMVDDFVTLKSSFTLDAPTDAQKKQSQTLISNAEYTVKIEKNEGTTLLYKVSPVTKSLVEVPLKDEAHFIINENHSPVIYIVKKDFMNLFELTNDSLKALTTTPAN
ncbi:DUF4340 domain-containing protein [Bacteriovorax sp. PP10]|uniref:DUF4340 domain-containing protein n=1 Tax=Bacteriovorax antarcticus TaxID=3088717 RepID=A0ABU5VSB5_9BACT|nr:DUF4340 domain-containing protein [Bacteriovorax sp. PP10]MEA9355946.1 DUF4340 domain-containing protein [Bacteriovorax sp. PP10]